MSSHFLGVVRDDGGQDFADGFEMHCCHGVTRFVARFEDTPETVLDADVNGDSVTVQGWSDDEWFCDDVVVERIDSAQGGVAVQFLEENGVEA
ncbi:hypothetical protein OB905_13265 [Halobacteria archaeon AArc-dxtr1]|nr:hypothetical protein [Halobacteria archaeon AArc-dxtr1]